MTMESSDCTEVKENVAVKEEDNDITDDLWDVAILSKASSSGPPKSSDEILTELFGAFNAKPPNSPGGSGSDNESTSKSKKKKKKKHKERKHKKKRSRKHSSGSDGDTSGSEKHERREKKKKKHKKSRHKDSSDNECKPKPIDSNGDLMPSNVKENNFNSNPKPTESTISILNDISSEEPSGSVTEPLKETDLQTESTTCEVTSSNIPSIGDSEVTSNIDKSESEKPLTKLSELASTNPEKAKSVAGKITIKNLKFSSVYEATVREVEEQAKIKADLYEEGEISDTSDSRKSSTDTGDGGDTTLESLKADSKKHATKSQKESSKTENLKDKKSRRSHSPETSSSHHKRSRHRSRSRDTDKKKDKERNRDRDKHRLNKDRHKDRNKDRSRDRSRDRDRRRGRSRSDSRSRKRSGSRSRRRSRSRDWKRDRRSPSGERIDKKKLLEIARRNAMSMLQQGILPPSMGIGLSQPDKPKSTAKTVDELTGLYRSAQEKGEKKSLISAQRGTSSNQHSSKGIGGGRSFQQPLKDFCKQLSKRENLGELSTLSDDETDSEKPFHHPFQVKDKPGSIIMNIKNATPLPVKTLQEKSAEQSKLRIQFPVSSGQLHRKTESEWVPVSPKRDNSLAVVPLPPSEPKITSKIQNADHPKLKAAEPPRQTMEEIDAMVSKRLTAMRMLHDSTEQQVVSYPPNYSSSAYNQHYQEMQQWGHQQALPGQFTPDAKVRILTPAELASGAQAWACKDQLVSARPVQSGMGMALLQKMGWRPGEGLGKNKEGVQVPLQLEVKLDRKGLVAQEELPGRKRAPPHLISQFQNQHQLSTVGNPQGNHEIATHQHQPVHHHPVTTGLEGKHPVSLLVEYCSKRHFGVPQFDICQESGPDHKKSFLFKVRVNGLEYQPNHPSPNKKQAKAEAATVCLKALGVILG